MGYGDNEFGNRVPRSFIDQRRREIQETAKYVRELETYSPKPHRPGERSYVTPSEAVGTLGLMANHRKIATGLMESLVSGASMIEIAKQANDAGLPRTAITEMLRRGARMIDEAKATQRPVLSPRIDGHTDPKRVTKSAEIFDLLKAEGGDKPPSGFSPIPKSSKGGFRKPKGSGYEYWYPGQGISSEPHGEDHADVHGDHVQHLEQKLAEAKEKTKPDAAVHAEFKKIDEKAQAAGIRLTGAAAGHHTAEDMAELDAAVDRLIAAKENKEKQSAADEQQSAADEFAGLSIPQQTAQIEQEVESLDKMVADAEEAGADPKEVAAVKQRSKAVKDELALISKHGTPNGVDDLERLKLAFKSLRFMVIGMLVGMMTGGGPGAVAGLAGGSAVSLAHMKRAKMMNQEFHKYPERKELLESLHAKMKEPIAGAPTADADEAKADEAKADEAKADADEAKADADEVAAAEEPAKPNRQQRRAAAAEEQKSDKPKPQSKADKAKRKAKSKQQKRSRKANRKAKKSFYLDLSTDRLVFAKAFTVEDVHDAADDAGVDWNDNQGFMDECESLTGKRHLDDMSEGELRIVAQNLSKGAGHKYLKRIPTGNKKRPWKYVYKVQHAGGVFNTEHMGVGSKFSAAGGHYHVAAKRGDKLLIRHDETGETRSVTKEELHKILVREHSKAIVAHKESMRKRLEKYKPGSYWHKRVAKQLEVWDKLPVEQQEKGWRDPKDVLTSPNFKSWFGDWQKGDGSKVVDSVGVPEEQFGQKPVKMFHGTPVGGFRSFSKEKDKGQNIFGRGFYFTADHEIATEYTRKDEDDAIYSARGWVGKDGKPITTLTREQMLEIVKTSGFSPTDEAGKGGWKFDVDPEKEYAHMSSAHPELKPHGNHDPNVIYAAAKASDSEGNVDVETFLKFFWQPEAEDLERHAKNYSGIKAHDSPYGASYKWMYRGLQKVMEEQGATPVIPESEVFEVYLNVRNPVDMESPVSKEQFDSFAKATIQKGIESTEATIERYEKLLKERQANQANYQWKDQWQFEGVKDDDRGKAPEGKVIVYPGGRREIVDPKEIPAMIAKDKANDLAYMQSEVDDAAGSIDRNKQILAERKKALTSKNPKITGMYLKSLIDMDDDPGVDRGYDDFLKIKRDLRPQRKVEYVDNKRVRTDDPAFGILHLTDENTLSWGDLHWMMSNGHSDPHIRGTFTDWAQAQGHDGIKHTGGWNIGTKEHDVWIAFEPNQIKATNAKEFNPGTDDIYKSATIEKAGPYIGPKGGKWADPQHKIPWKDDHHAEIHEHGTKFQTGHSVVVPVTHRKQKTQNFGSRYGQDIEPAGRYVVHGHHGEQGTRDEGWGHKVTTTHDTVHFKNPLVIHHNGTGSEPGMWKRRLSDQYGGKKGKALSRAIAKDGHDAIVTVDSYNHRGQQHFSTSEIVDLTHLRKSATIEKSGPFIGPRGGKWADAKHTIPWSDEKPKRQATPPKPKRKPPGSQLAAEDLTKLRELGVTKLPEAAIPLSDIQISFDNPHTTAVIKWRDKGGKTQSGYTPKFHETNARLKWDRVMAWRDKMPRVTRTLQKELKASKPGSLKHQGLLVANIIAATGLRPGGAGMKAGHHGVANLTSKHIQIDGNKVSMDFIGKQGKRNTATIRNKAVAEAVAHYKKGGNKLNKPIFSSGVVKQARDSLPRGLKLKDLRTLVATQKAIEVLDKVAAPPPLTGNRKKDKRLLAKAILQASKQVAAHINNTPAVARSTYIHPEVFKQWAIEKAGADASLFEGES